MRFFSRRNASLVLSLAAVGVLAACGDDVTVPVAPAAPVTVSITPQAISLTPGSTAQLSVQITGGDPTPTLASCASGSAAVATAAVSGNGCRVTAVAAGSTTITATTSAGQAASAAVNVSAAPAAITSFSVSPASASVAIGGTTQITPVINKAADAVTTTVSYVSSATSIATVSTSGLVTGVAQGNATVTVSVTGSGAGFSTVTQTAAVAITVAPPAQVIINSLTDNGAVIDINNVVRQFEVNLSLQPNGQIVQSVEAWVCLQGETVAQCAARSGTPAAQQTYGTAGAQAGAVQLYINSAEFAAPNFTTGADANTLYKNGLKTIVATVTTAGATAPTASNNLSSINFNNVDGWTVSWTAPANKANDVNNVTWYGGPSTPDALTPSAQSGTGAFVVVPVIYTPNRTVVQAVVNLSTACGSNITDYARPFGGTYGTAAADTLSFNFKCAGVTGTTGLAPKVMSAIDNNNNAYPGTVATPAVATSIFEDFSNIAAGTPGGFRQSLAYRPNYLYLPHDYQAPTAAVVDVRGGNATADGGWVNGAYPMNSTLATDFTDGAGVGLFAEASRNTRFSVCASPTTTGVCSSPVATGGYTATVASMGLGESTDLTNGAYFVNVAETDRLGNKRTVVAYAGTPAAAVATMFFGVDLTAPVLATIPNTGTGSIAGYIRTDRDSIFSTAANTTDAADIDATEALFAIRFTDARSGFPDCAGSTCMAGAVGTHKNAGKFQIRRHVAATAPNFANAATAANIIKTGGAEENIDAFVSGADAAYREFTINIFGQTARKPSSVTPAATVDGYYRFTGSVTDRAGNSTTLPTRWVVIDNAIPTADLIDVAQSMTGGATGVSFGVRGSDALEIIAGDLALQYPLLGTNGRLRFNRVPTYSSTTKLGFWHNPFQTWTDAKLVSTIGPATTLGATPLAVPAPFIHQLVTVKAGNVPPTSADIDGYTTATTKPSAVWTTLYDVLATSSRDFNNKGASAAFSATIPGSAVSAPSPQKNWDVAGRNIDTWQITNPTPNALEFRAEMSTSTENNPFVRVHVVRKNGAYYDYLGDATLAGTFDQGGKRYFRYTFSFASAISQGQFSLGALEIGDIVRAIGVDAGGNALSTADATLSGPPALTGLTVSPSSITFAVGQSQSFTATPQQPSGATAAVVTWSVSGPCTLTSSGYSATVAGTGVGTCTLTASATAAAGGGYDAVTTPITSSATINVTALTAAITSVTVPTSVSVDKTTTYTVDPVVTAAGGVTYTTTLIFETDGDSNGKCFATPGAGDTWIIDINPNANSTCTYRIIATATSVPGGYELTVLASNVGTINFIP